MSTYRIAALAVGLASLITVACGGGSSPPAADAALADGAGGDATTFDAPSADAPRADAIPNTCDQEVDCSACTACANDPGGPCAALWDACANEPMCIGLVDCLSGCTDPTCTQTCADTYPDGIAGYNAVAACISCVCPMTCMSEPPPGGCP